MKYKVIDNIIPAKTQSRIEEMVKSPHFSWHIMKNSSYHENSNTPNFWTTIPTIGYVRTVVNDGVEYSPDMMPWCLQILDNALDQQGLELDELYRIQINMLYQNVSIEYKDGMWTTAHIDQDDNHKVLLYYINDSDGDTFLFHEEKGSNFEEFTIRTRVSPKKGRGVIFDGDIFHSASNPINTNKRLVINYNFTTKERDGRDIK